MPSGQGKTRRTVRSFAHHWCIKSWIPSLCSDGTMKLWKVTFKIQHDSSTNSNYNKEVFRPCTVIFVIEGNSFAFHCQRISYEYQPYRYLPSYQVTFAYIFLSVVLLAGFEIRGNVLHCSAVADTTSGMAFSKRLYSFEFLRVT